MKPRQHPSYDAYRQQHPQLAAFADWLRRTVRMGEAGILRQTGYAALFLSWLEAENTLAAQVRYSELLAFLDYCEHTGTTTEQRQRMLIALRHYFSFHGIDPNPAASLRLQSRPPRLPHDLLDETALEALWLDYPSVHGRNALTLARNHAILGLIVFQALSAGDLQRLTPAHLDLARAVVNARRRSLPLTGPQVMGLASYLGTVRPALLRQANSTSAALFPGQRGGDSIRPAIRHVLKCLRRLHPQLRSAQQLRQSRLSLWLKTGELRRVQHLAGHRKVKSTERYRSHDLDALAAQLQHLHPLETLGR